MYKDVGGIVVKRLTVLFMILVLVLSNITYAKTKFVGASSWAIGELEKAVENDIISYDDFVKVEGGYANMITREQFAELIMKVYFNLMGEYPEPAAPDTFTDTRNAYVFMANSAGIISGRGNGIFAPDDTITRQDMSIMIFRTIQSIGVDYKSADNILAFADKDLVDSWAVSSVDFVYENALIQGDGTNFAPKDNTPIEQAVMIVNRVFEKYEDVEVTEPSDYRKGYQTSIIDGDLYVTFNNSGEKVRVAQNVSRSEFSTEDYSKLYYLSKSDYKIWLCEFRDLSHKGYNWLVENVADFRLVVGGEYDGHIIAEVNGPYESEFKVYKGYSHIGNSNYNAFNNPEYYVSEVYRKIEEEKYGFAITVTDPSNGYNNAKFKVDDMYFYSSADYDSYVEDQVGYLQLSPYYNEDDAYTGPMGRPGDRNTQWIFNGYGGIYETEIDFSNYKEGNAGIVFNLKWAGDGNDNYAGYYAGIDFSKYLILVGRADYGKWTCLQEKLMLISAGANAGKNKKLKLKVVKNGSNIKVYCNNYLYLEVDDSTYMNDGGFGVRTWKADATYSNYTIKPLPY